MAPRQAWKPATELTASRQISISCTDGEIVGHASHYRQLIQLMQRRIADLGLTYDSVDELCGFCDKYTGKLMCGQKALSIYSFLTIARALALLPMFAHDQLQLTNMRHSSGWRPFCRNGPRYRRRTDAPRDEPVA
jgi:hypothetical protein